MDKLLIPNSKFVFFGTPRFAEIVLEKLIKGGMPPTLVVTNPDRPVGRKQVITPPPIKVVAEKYNIPVMQPEDLKNFKFSARGGSSSGGQISNFEFAILASYGKIIPKEIIDLFPKGIIVVHGSLLPKYRGATPIQTALLNGDTMTGISLLLMDEKVDHGSIISNFSAGSGSSSGGQFPISEHDTYTSLIEKLANVSADLLLKIIPDYLKGKVIPKEQNHAEATFTKKFKTEDGFVSWDDLKKAEEQGGENAIKIDRMIRALNPDPGVYTMKEGKRIKLLEARLDDGRLKLVKIQGEGKKPKIIEARPR